jgi:phage terminase large subunit-like protein
MSVILSNPILQQAYEADWYFPPDLPPEILNDPLYEKAVEEGWHEWIETPLDFTAVKKGFGYDLSRDVDNKPIYWIDGHWQTQDGSIIPVDDEQDAVGYVGRGDHMMRFCETFLNFTKEPLIGQPFRFLPWMRKIFAPLYGWVNLRSKAKLRRFQFLYLAVSKKNGKSYIISAISNYMLVADGTPKAQCYICACDRNQARIIYDEARNMVNESDLLKPMIDVVESRARLVYPETASYLQVLSSDAHRNDGYDSSYTAVDEIHRHPNRKLFSVMERAGRARPEPMLCVITTYGPSTTDGSIWAEIHNEAKAQLVGDRPDSWRRMNVIASSEPIPITAKEDAPVGATRIKVGRLQQPVDVGPIEFDISQLDGEKTVEVTVTQPAKRFQTYIDVAPIEAEIPQFSEATANQEWNTLHGVMRSNPSAGIIFDPQVVLDEAKNIRGPEMEAETKQLSFNITSGSGKRWISAAVWHACGEMQVQPKHLLGRQAFAAIDFSWGGDLVALGVAVPKWDMSIPFLDVENPRIDLLTWAWVPDELIEEREEKEQFPYRYHAAQPYLFDDKGHIRICKGSVADFNQIVPEAIEILRQFQILAIGYDPNYAQFSIPKFVAEGFTCIEHRQGATAMGPACKRFRDMLHSRQIAHGNVPVLDRAAEGAVPHPPDKAGNIYLSKGESKVKIDPLVSHVMSVNFCTNPPIVQSGAYADSSSGVWG